MAGSSSPEPHPGPRRLALAAITFALFVGDLVTPLGVAAGMPYVIVVLLAARPGLRRLVYEAAIVTTLLTCVGVLFSPPGGEPWVVAFNRVLAILVIWATAMLSTQLMQASRQLAAAEREATEDPLTRLRNRRGFESLVASAVGRQETALVMLDLDRFKRVNDDLGHPTGDQALIAVADRLREVLRSGDSWNCARLGGDEFALLLPATSAEDAEAIAGRLKAAIDPVLAAIHPACSISFGVGAGERGTDPEALYAAADEQLYRAKSART